MPAVWELTIQKRIGQGKPWVNKYFLSPPEQALASVAAESILSFEQEIHYPDILFTSYRLSTVDPNSGTFYIVPINVNGTRGSATSPLPLFNTVQMYLTVDGGRPSFKYYRCLTEFDQDNSTLTVGMMNAVMAAATTNLQPVITSGALVDESGNEFVGFSINPIVKMRSRTRRARAQVSNPGGNPS